MNAFAPLLSAFLLILGSGRVRAGDLPLLKLTLSLDVPNCEAFDDVAVGRAYCTAFAEEAPYEEGTFECFTEETECVADTGRRLLLDFLSRRSLVSESAKVVLGGTFGGLEEEEVEDRAFGIFGNETRLDLVKEKAVGFLRGEGADESADLLENANVEGGSPAVEAVERECEESVDCTGPATAPICRDGFCVACNSTFVTSPAVQGDCAEARVCMSNGSCFQQQVVASFETDTSQIGLEWDCPAGCDDFLFRLQCFEGPMQTCRLDESSAGTPQPSGSLNGTITRLNPSTNYTCFVIGNDTTGESTVCSPPTDLITTNCEGLAPLPAQGTCSENQFCRLFDDGTDCVLDQCDVDDDCAGDFPICRIESSPRLCVECAEQETPPVAGNCGANRFCRASGMCSEAQCSESIECGEQLVCLEGMCVQCADSSDCDSDQLRPVCTGNSTCAGCEVNSFPAEQGEGGCEPGFFCRLDGSCQPTQCANGGDCGDPEVYTCQDSTCVELAPPGAPAVISSNVNARSVEIFWNDGEEGVPVERYSIQCLDSQTPCNPEAVASFNIERGVQNGVRGDLSSGANFTCFVIASNVEGSTCSAPLDITTELPTSTQGLPTPAGSVEFGFSVAMTRDGLFALVGDPGFNNEQGAIYLLRFVDGTVDQWEEIESWTGEEEGTRFGDSISFNEDGTIIIAGAPDGLQVGILQKDSTTDVWPANATFVYNPVEDGQFGTSVSISGRTAIVGSPAAESSKPGRVFSMEISESGPEEMVEVFCRGNSSFCGSAVSIKGNNFVASAMDDGVILFERDNGSSVWEPIETFENPGSDKFGQSVALDFASSLVSGPPLVLAVGAPSAGNSSGSMFFFLQAESKEWSSGPLFQPLEASPEFGSSVDLSPLTVTSRWAVGDPGFEDNGAVFIGLLSDGVLLSISDPLTLEDETRVGQSIALGQSRILIGSEPLLEISTQVLALNQETSVNSLDFTEASIPGPPQDLQPVVFTERVELSWTVGLEGTPEEFYIVKCVETWTEDCDSVASGFQVGNIARSTPFANITGLQSGRPYSCFVIANNLDAQFCEVQSSINITTARLPEPPTALSVPLTSSTSLLLGWAAGSPQGIPAERFFAKCVLVGEGCSGIAVGGVNFVPNGGRVTELDGLSENTEYDCFVIASNSVAPFDPDTGVGGVCSEGLTTRTLLAPGRPLNPRLISRSNTSVALQWVDGTEGIPMETYAVKSVLPGGTCSSSSQGLPLQMSIPRGTGVGFVADLTPGTTFVSFAIARNNVTSPPGICSQSVTSTTTRAPLPPSSVGVSDVGEVSVVLTWTDGNTPAVPEERFTVRCGPLAGECTNATIGIGQNVARKVGEAVLTGLSPDTSYTCFVSARSNGGAEVCSTGVLVRTTASFCFPATSPAVQGNCREDEFCRSDGTCSTEQCDTNMDCGGLSPVCNDQNLCAACTEFSSSQVQGECESGLFCAEPGACLPPRLPGSAFGLNMLQRNISEVTLEWVPGVAGFPLESYEVKCVLDEVGAGCASPSRGSSASNLARTLSPNATVTNLSSGENYLCFVVASNAATPTSGICSNSLSVRTLRPPATPTRLAVEETTDTQITLAWSDGEEAVPAELYEVRCQTFNSTCRLSGAGQGISSTGIERGVREGTVTSLVRNTEFTCYVVAYNRAGDFACSAGVEVRTERQQCNPSRRPAVQGSCPDEDFCIQGLCFSTQCRSSEDCGGNQPICEVGQCVACSPRVTPAEQANCLEGTFCAISGACLSPVPAGPPGGLSAESISVTSVNISWTVGSEAFPQETYTLKCVRPDEGCSAVGEGNSDAGIPRGTSGAAQGFVTGLSPGTEYDCFVVAISLSGNSQPSEVCSSPLSIQTERAPSAPQNLRLLMSTLNSLEIGWEDGPVPGIPPETLAVRCYEGTELDCRAPNPSGEEAGIARGVEVANITGLLAFTEYTCYVLAFNDAVPDGVCSEGLASRTAPLAPLAPTNLNLLGSTMGSLEIGWEDGPLPGIPPETLAVRCYEGTELDCRAPNPSGEEAGIARGVEVANITGLLAFTEYTCYVLAFNDAVPDGVCSEGLVASTDECETDVDCDRFFYKKSFCLVQQPPLSNICVECLVDADCEAGELCSDNNECIQDRSNFMPIFTIFCIYLEV